HDGETRQSPNWRSTRSWPGASPGTSRWLSPRCGRCWPSSSTCTASRARRIRRARCSSSTGRLPARSASMPAGTRSGPGFRPNATIGRAIRLIMTTIGGGVPQQADKSTLGNPAKYTCCFAENEGASPWLPLHVERGFEAGTSAVTVFGGAAPANIIEKSKTASEMLDTIAHAMAVSGSNNMFMSQEALLVLGPEHAAIAAREGFDKERVRQTLFAKARIPFEQIGGSNAAVLGVWRGNCITEADGRRSLRIVEKPDDIVIV